MTEPITTDPPANPLRHELYGEAPIVDWLYPNMLAAGTVVVLAGLPGTGKSLLSYTLGMSLACGLPFLGHETARPRRVLYFDEENSIPDRLQYERWAWFGLGHEGMVDRVCENFWVKSHTLGGQDWMEVAATAMLEHHPDLVVFDTATPAFAIAEENDNGEASRTVAKLRHLQGILPISPTMLVLKHAKRYEDGALTLRGAKAWEGAVDGFIFAGKKAGRPRKDGYYNVTLKPGKTRAFGLRQPITTDPHLTLDGKGLALGVLEHEVEVVEK